MASRIQLHSTLCEILGCPERGKECRCYFQAPGSVSMTYPAIVYSLDDMDNKFADDGVYLTKRKYLITLIDKNPDSPLIDKLNTQAFCKFSRHYKADNLNHYVYILYF